MSKNVSATILQMETLSQLWKCLYRRKGVSVARKTKARSCSMVVRANRKRPAEGCRRPLKVSQIMYESIDRGEKICMLLHDALILYNNSI